MNHNASAAQDFVREIDGEFKTILADPPWRFQNNTGKVAPEHKRLSRFLIYLLTVWQKKIVIFIYGYRMHYLLKVLKQ